MQDLEDTRWIGPSEGLWRMRRAELVIVTLVVASTLGMIFLITEGLLAGAISAVTVLAAGVASAWFVHRRFAAWRYQERHEDLIVARGVMVHRLSVVPYGRMQFVEVTAGPIERLFRLSTVKLHTAAEASDARILGLEQAEAALLRPLTLATLHVDLAGKRARAEFRDRDVEVADQLVADLTALSRLAREGDRRSSPAPGGDAPPSGWYPDPASRHEQRY